jgi:hypothetical protein
MRQRPPMGEGQSVFVIGVSHHTLGQLRVLASRVVLPNDEEIFRDHPSDGAPSPTELSDGLKRRSGLRKTELRRTNTRLRLRLVHAARTGSEHREAISAHTKLVTFCRVIALDAMTFCHYVQPCRHDILSC